MQTRKLGLIAAGAAALAILLAAGFAAVPRSDAAKDAAPTGASNVTAEPDGAEEWMYLQRANPDGSIPDAAVTEAIAQSRAAGKASQGSPSTDQVWTELGPSNIGGRIRDVAADPTTANVVYIATGSGGLWRSADGGQTFATAWNHY